MAYGDEQSMRILPSQSTAMKRNVGSIWSSIDFAAQAVLVDDPCPVVHACAAQGIDAQGHPGVLDGRHVDHAGEIVDVIAHEIVTVHAGIVARAREGNAQNVA